MAFGPITSWQIEGEKVENSEISFWALKSLQMVTAAVKLEMIASQQESYDKPRQCIEKKRHYSADKGLYTQGYDLPSGHIQL